MRSVIVEVSLKTCECTHGDIIQNINYETKCLSQCEFCALNYKLN